MKFVRARSMAAVVGTVLIASLGANSAAGADARGTDKSLGRQERRDAAMVSVSQPDGEVSSAAAASFVDPANDGTPFADCRGDIVAFSASYDSQTLAVSLTTACPSNPHSDASWYPGVTSAAWYFDVNGDLQDDYFVVFYNRTDTGVVAEVYQVRGAGEPMGICIGTPFWDGSRAFAASFNSGCIASPPQVRVQAYMEWDEAPFQTTCQCPYDVAPDLFGYSPPIARTDPVPVIPLGDGPAAASRTGGTMDVFGRGTDDALWTRHFDGGTWGEWTSLGGRITGTPAATSADSGELDVFVRGTDNALWTKHFDGTWSGWTSLSGVLSTPPAVVSSSQNTLDVFVAGSDTALWTRHFDGSSWSGWTSRGGRINATPAAASSDVGVIDVFARGADNALWTQHFAGTWSTWSSLGGTISSAPGAASAGSASVEVFARGTDNALWTNELVDGVPGGWFTLGGTIASPPAPVSPALDQTVVFVRGTNSAVWMNRRPSSSDTWDGWTTLGGLIK